MSKFRSWFSSTVYHSNAIVMLEMYYHGKQKRVRMHFTLVFYELNHIQSKVMKEKLLVNGMVLKWINLSNTRNRSTKVAVMIYIYIYIYIHIYICIYIAINESLSIIANGRANTPCGVGVGNWYLCHKNTERHTTHTIVSWSNPKQ